MVTRRSIPYAYAIAPYLASIALVTMIYQIRRWWIDNDDTMQFHYLKQQLADVNLAPEELPVFDSKLWNVSEKNTDLPYNASPAR
ncbi:MAG: hypothetical protein FJ146_18860, partial [Deltaproteobacteria bacterium]|nr:hypothetical protein [Deltaproteobacteria bacterium]